LSDAPPFWERPLDSLSATEWEALCDGCGKCCLHKVEEEERPDGEVRIYPTNVACRLLNRETGRCMDYARRRRFVPDCVRLTSRNVADIPWLPLTCAYRLRAAGEPLPEWHYLRCGDRDAVHRAGQSVRGWTVGEREAGPLEHHIVDREI